MTRPPIDPRLASLVLAGCCVLWGLSFPMIALMMEGLGRHGVDSLAAASLGNAWRFSAAALAMLALTAASMGRLNRRELVGGALLGLAVSLGMCLQSLGLRWVLPSVSGLITAMVVVLTPLAQALILRRAVGWPTILAAATALVGTVILTAGGASSTTAGSLTVAPPFPYAGEIITGLGTLCFTVHILLIDRFGPGTDPMRLTTVMVVCVAVACTVLALVGQAPVFDAALLATLAGETRWLLSMLALALLCTVGALSLMNRFQPAVDPARATVIYCLEPVFALLWSLALGQERMTWATAVGGVLVIGAALSVARRPH
jgi:drug/metabolite transporter (DMT)-like permease